MMIWIYTLGILLGSFNVGATFSPGDTRDLQELEKIVQKNRQTERLHRGCRRQLREQRAPVDCYFHATLSQQRTLDQLCQKWAHSLRLLESVLESLDKPGLSVGCAKTLQEREKVLRYQLIEKDPEKAIFFRQ